MARLSALCVYCGSSDRGDAAHLSAAAMLGRLAARRGVEIVFGGGRVGLMGAVADGALAEGGRVTGVIPRHLMDREVGHNGLSRLEIVDSMHQRKQRMSELSDAFCILPGGLGTLDETFEIVTWKQLGLHDKPVILVDLGGFWSPLLRLVDHQVAGGYVRPQHARLLTVVGRVEQVFEAVADAPAPAVATQSQRL